MLCNEDVQMLAERLKTSTKTGLCEEEAQKRLSLYGKNVLEKKKHDSLVKRFFMQLNDYMVIILLIAAAVSFFMSLLNGDTDYFDPIIILSIVVLNACIGVFQESKAQKALDALQKMSAPTVCVMRDGKKRKIEAAELVVGDVIFVASGDLVPADARLTEAFDLKCDEAPLTGEALPAEKDAKFTHEGEINPADAKSMIFSSCVVTGGHGSAVVTATGMDTQVGKIAKMIIESNSAQTPLQEKLARTGKTLGIMALVICALIFAMGIMRRMPVLDMLMTSISLAVAAIPEGLVSIVTIILALGVQRMARKNAVIRQLPAVETLGSASVICSDKTGTLTQNKMSVVKIYGNRSLALDLASLCNNSSDATERAILEAAELDGCETELLRKKYIRVAEESFDSKKKYMLTIHKTDNGYRMIVKGAPEVVLPMCGASAYAKSNAENENLSMARDALRVMAVAYKDIADIRDRKATDLALAGLIGMLDPPRPEAESAVRECHRAGIKTVMITGDHIETARAIASHLGIYKDGDKAMSGVQLNAISDDELVEVINEYSVFARVTPEHKVRIVRAFARRGEVVAMTGDGVNDAPALKSADIGCAMGQNGSDVCKEAADMILCDDNFATIVSAVKEGRVIFSNIKKAVHFLLSSNMGEIITIFAAILFGWQTPLAAIHLLWINLVTDSLPAIALGFEAADENIMCQKPINRRKGLLADGMGAAVLAEGTMIATLALIAYSIGINVYRDYTAAQTMSFCVLCLSQLVHAFNMRSDESLFKVGIFSNKIMNIAFGVCALLQLAVVCVSPLARIFKVTMLTGGQWGIVGVLALMPFAIMEAQKLIGKRSDEKSRKQRKFLLER